MGLPGTFQIFGGLDETLLFVDIQITKIKTNSKQIIANPKDTKERSIKQYLESNQCRGKKKNHDSSSSHFVLQRRLEY